MRRTAADDRDPFEDALELARARQRDPGRPRPEEDRDQGELIEGADELTFVLMAPGYSRADLDVRVEEGALKVEAYDFKFVRALRFAVEPSTARSTYVNGVLSVRVARRA